MQVRVGWNIYQGSGALDRTSSGGNLTTGDRAGVANLPGNPSADGNSYLFAANGTTTGLVWAAIDTFSLLTPGTADDLEAEIRRPMWRCG